MVSFQKRDQVQRLLKEAGIASEVYYPQPLHLTAPCRVLEFHEGQYPVSEQASRSLLALPLYPEMTGAQIEEVCAEVEKAIQATR
jgi:dTDP-4-amino-4,6-dideoxygalactose transaminase